MILVGNPNVGKSALFAALTGRYVAVSNYPGTTVEVASGTLSIDGGKRQVVDTPGVRSLVAVSDDERVARDIVLGAEDAALVQVADAKDLRRSLLLTLELAETGIPFALDLNMIDEAARRGVRIDDERLSAILGVPVVSTVATRRDGVDALGHALHETRAARVQTTFPPAVERAVEAIEPLLPADGIRPRALALMLLADDSNLAERLDLSTHARELIHRAKEDAEHAFGGSVGYALNRTRLAEADRFVDDVVRWTPTRAPGGERVASVAADRFWGWAVLAAVLVVVYLFVGRFGAGTMVGWLEKDVFGRVVNPWARHVAAGIPIGIVERFLVGRYGVVTMALTYGLAIVLPIVTTFFFAFGVLEDSGYLPRLAIVLDRAFRRIGLNGKAVLPMVLGLGCVTMATMTTRILETRKERIQVTLLLALSIPCSAQLGVILGMIGSTGLLGIAIWGSIVIGSLLGVGWLAAKLIPGQAADFVLELPPMRVPRIDNIARKTWARLAWYLREVIPVFIIGTAVLFVFDELGLLRVLEGWLAPVVVGWLGLPTAATAVLIIGFLRRDYGAAGMFALAAAGGLTGGQVLVSLVVISLFVPCVASVLMIAKEHGTRIAAGMTVFTLVFAVAAGAAVHAALEVLGVSIG